MKPRISTPWPLTGRLYRLAKIVFQCLWLVSALSVTTLRAAEAPIAIDRSGTNVSVSWTNSGTLLEAAVVTGPWTPSAGSPSSPHVLPIRASAMFFRVQYGTNFSPNAVGYIRQSLGAGWTLLANPLHRINNDLLTILTLPISAEATLYRFNVSAQRFDRFQFVPDLGWFSADSQNSVFNPGEGFLFRPDAPTPLEVIFIGEVPQGNLVTMIPGSSQSILSSQVPQSLPLGAAGQAGTLQFPAVDGDTVYVFNSATQGYQDSYTYFAGLGWFSRNPDDPGSNGPVIPLGTSFVLRKSGSQVPWTRVFNIQ